MGGYIGATAVGLTTTAADVQGDITSTDTTPELILKNTSEEDTEGGREGKITFKGEQSGGEESTLAQIESAHDGTSDDQKGDLIFKTNDGSDGASPTERVRIDSAGNVGLGTNSPSYPLHVSSTSSSNARILLEASSGAAADGPILDLYRNSPSPADDDDIGIIYFSGENDADEKLQYARIDAFIEDASDGTEDGRVTMQVVSGGANKQFLGLRADQGGADGEVVINESQNDIDFRIESNSATNLFVADASTNRIGIGESTPDNPLHITTSNSGDVIKVESTEAGAGHGPNLNLFRNSASPADSDMIGRVNFNGTNSAGETLTYGQIQTQIRDVTDGTEDSLMKLGLRSNGTFVDIFTANEGGTVFNEDSANRDFRIESNNVSNMFKVDASTDEINIGRSDSITGTRCVTIQSGSNQVGMELYRPNTGSTNTMFNILSNVGSTENVVIHMEANGDIEIDGTLTQSSDARIKQDIVDSESQWDDIKALQVRKYRRIWDVEQLGDDAPVHIGVIAQELEASGMGGLVKDMLFEETEPNGRQRKQVKYSVLYMKAVKALQEAMTRIETLETQNTTQATQIADLITRVEALEGA